MGVFFNTAFTLISTTIIYFKYGFHSNYDESCILQMERLEEIIDSILSSKNSPSEIHKNTKNLYDACLQTVECFEQTNNQHPNSIFQEWSDLFQRKIKPVCDSLRYQSGEFFKCISRFLVGIQRSNSTSSDFNECFLDDSEYETLSNFVEKKCGFLAVKNMMEYENHVRSTLCQSIRKGE